MMPLTHHTVGEGHESFKVVRSRVPVIGARPVLIAGTDGQPRKE